MTNDRIDKLAFTRVGRTRNTETFVDDENPRKKRVVCYSKRRFYQSLLDGEWKDEVETVQERGSLRIRNPHVDVAGFFGTDTFTFFDENNVEILDAAVHWQYESTPGVWTDIPFVLPVPESKTDPERGYAYYEWSDSLSSALGTSAIQLAVEPRTYKWLYRFTANQRMNVRPVLRLTPTARVANFRTTMTRASAPDPAGVRWQYERGDGARFQFKDWRESYGVDYTASVFADAGVTIVGVATSLGPGEFAEVDPTAGPIDGDYSADSDGGSKYEGDSEWVGDGGGENRATYKFLLPSGGSAIPTGSTVNQVGHSVYVASSGSSQDWRGGAYGGDGYTNDPESDSAANFYSRCAIGTNKEYITTTSFTSTGQKTFSDLTENSNLARSEVQTAVANSATFFAIAWQGDSGVSDGYCELEETNVGGNDATLTIEYTEPSIDIEIPSAASLTLTGQTPTIGVTADVPIVVPNASSLSLTGQTPTIGVTADQTITIPSAASLSLTGQTPTVVVTADVPIVVPSEAALSLAGQTPTIPGDTTITVPNEASLTLTGQTPTINQGINIDVPMPTFGRATQVTGSAGSASVSGTSLTPAVASSVVQNGDWFLLVWMSTNTSAPSFTDPSGFSAVASVSGSRGTYRVLQKRVTDIGSEDFSPTISHSGSATPCVALLFVIRYGDETSLVQQVTTADRTNDNTPLIAPLTPETPNATLYAFMQTQDASATALAYPAGWAGQLSLEPGSTNRWFGAARLYKDDETVETGEYTVTDGDGTGDPLMMTIEVKNQRTGPGALTVVGQTPTIQVTDHIGITIPNASSLALTGQTPTVGITVDVPIVLPNASALSLTGQTPTIGVGADVPIVIPNAASLTLTGQVPTIGITLDVPIVIPNASALSLAGQTPVIGVGADVPIVIPNAAALTVTGQTPTIEVAANVTIVIPSAAALLFEGQTPTLGITADIPIVIPNEASLTLTGQTPTIGVTGDVLITIPSAAELLLTGYAPILDVDQTILIPSAALLTLTGYAPSIDASEPVTIIIPGEASLVLTGQVPELFFTPADEPGGWVPEAWVQ